MVGSGHWKSSSWFLLNTNSATSLTTIEQLRKLFAVHGLPELIISDNGPAFSSDEFKVFMKKNGIRHRQTAPYHPSSNGLAERAVQSFKLALKKSTSGTLQQRLSDFLLYQHITPHTTTGRPPAELLMGRKLRSKLDLLIPDVSLDLGIPLLCWGQCSGSIRIGFSDPSSILCESTAPSP